MKRILTTSQVAIAAMVLGLVMFLVLMGFLFTCDEARADWVGTASLIPGKYMLIDIDQGKTFQVAYLRAMLTPEQQAEETMDLIEILIGMVFIVDKDKNVVHIPLTSKSEIASRLIDLI